MISEANLPSARDDDRILRQSDQCWQEGYRAGQRRASIIDCPYPVASNENWSWSSGYIEGKAVRLKSCQCKIDVNRKH